MKRKFLFKEWFFFSYHCFLLCIFFYSHTAFASRQQTHEIINLRGTIKITAFLYPPGKEKAETIAYNLITPQNAIYEIRFTDKAPWWLKTGVTVKIQHALKEEDKHKQILITSSSQLTLLKDIAKTAIPSAFGPQKTIVMLVNFSDKPNVKPYTLEQVRETVFNAVSNNYLESSYRQTTIIGEVVGWFTLPIASTTDCTLMANRIPALAAQAAANAGVDVSAYRRRIYLFPTNFSCPWIGLGEIGGESYTNTWLNGVLAVSTTAHELGHNLGLYHSHFLKCPGTANQGNCTSFEYGDEADTMGNAGAYHFNAFQKDRLGWLNYGSSPPILTVTSSGNYIIAPYETNERNTKALKILKRISASGAREYYYLEFRQGIGIDAELASCRDCDFTRGVLVHQGNDMDANSSHLLDMTPADNRSRIVALLPGKTFVDETAGVSFTVNSLSNEGANVRVTIGPVTPPPPNPDGYDYVYPDGIANYTAGTKVLGSDNKVYKCKPYPASGWCSQSPFYYEPGRGVAWQMAWDLLS